MQINLHHAHETNGKFSYEIGVDLAEHSWMIKEIYLFVETDQFVRNYKHCSAAVGRCVHLQQWYP